MAHPRQLHDWRGDPPNLYDISGSAHFINKADAGIVIHRNWEFFEFHNKRKFGSGEFNNNNYDDEYDDINRKMKEEGQYLVSVMVRKMRNKAAGTVGILYKIKLIFANNLN